MRFGIAFLIFLSHLWSLTAQRNFIADSLDQYINQGLKDWRIPGLAVAIVKDGKVVMTKGYGVKDIKTQQAVDEHSLFMIASNSKAITGMSLALLDFQKKLSLDDKIIKWLPDFKLYDEHSTNLVTIKDIVTHRIGFETFQGDFAHWSTNATSDEVIRRMSRIKPIYNFRDKYGYCNAGYAVAGKIIEKASGLSWDQYVTQNFIQALGMTETQALTKTYGQTPNHCTPYTIYKDELIPLKIPNIDNMAPATSICSSVSDWSKWLLMLLNEGKYNGAQIIPERVIAKSIEPVSIRGNFRPKFNNGHFTLYGLGWVLQDYAGRKIISHTGGADGFVTSVTWLPEEELGIIVLTNTDANQFYMNLRWEIMDAYLQLPFRNYSALALKDMAKEQAEEKKWLQSVTDSVTNFKNTKLPLKKYAGTYDNNVYGKITIKVDPSNKKLIVDFPLDSYRSATLEPMSDDRFLCTYANPLLGIKVFPFVIKKNKIKSVTVSCADFVEFTPYIFNKN